MSQRVYAALMTARGAGAIAVVMVHGGGAADILANMFTPAVEFERGRVYVGRVVDGDRIIDQAAIGCEAADTFAVNCHGNPLIVERLMELLARSGVELVSCEKMTAIRSARTDATAIETEAKIAQMSAVTLAGTELVLNQVDGGLGRLARQWVVDWQDLTLEQLQGRAREVLNGSMAANRLIYGVKIILAGAPNAGKSTLLNALAGSSKAIVSDIAGTTRDWVSATCSLGNLQAEIIDTAGLEERLAARATTDLQQQSRRQAMAMVARADLVLLVTEKADTSAAEQKLLELCSGKLLKVQNKADLAGSGKKPDTHSRPVPISAKTGWNLDGLIAAIADKLGTANIRTDEPAAFTERQRELLEATEQARTKEQAFELISRLLNGPVSV